MSDLLYRPELGYEKKYDTTGTFLESSDTAESPTPTPDTPDPLDDLKNDLIEIDTIVGSLPDSLSGPIRSVVSGVRHLVNEIDPQTFNPEVPTAGTVVVVRPGGPKTTSPGPVTDPSQSTPENPSGITLPTDVFSDSIPDIKVEVVKTDVSDIIPREYDNAVVSIVADYASNLKKALSGYASNVATVAGQSGIMSISFLNAEYTSKTTDIKDKNLHHLSDWVIRSQIVRDQKARMMKKLNSPKETISHIRACTVAKQLRERYYSEEFVQNNQYLNVGQNEILSNSRLAYDRKYKENLFNLYKYLNSSVILISECLGMMIQESQAKAVLYKEEGMS